MPYYHVIAKIASGDNVRCLFVDLSTSELQERFVRPYERGKSFFSGNELISPGELRSVQIIRTDRPDQTEREEIDRIDRAKIDEINRSNDHILYLSVGGGYQPEDIAQAGEDVTRTFIKAPPGFKAVRLAHILKVLGWVGGVIAAVIAAGIAKWFGWI